MDLSLKLPRVLPVIYGMFNTVTGQFYIGSTEYPSKRRKQHHTKLVTKTHDNKFLERSVHAHGGIDILEFRILQELSSKEELTACEQQWLDKYYDDQKVCYNICPNANRTTGKKDSPKETARKRKMMLDPEVQKHVTFKGHNHTEDSKKLIAESNKLKPRISSEASKDKLRNAPYTKPVLQMTMDGTVIARFRSSAHAEQVLGIKNLGTWITRCCKGKQAFAKGFKWSYA